MKPISGRIVIATHNAGKLDEFRKLLNFYPGEIVSAGQLGLPSPEETGNTFVENSILKAKAASLATGHIALADDSGLCVTGLGDRPGLYSARWAENGSFFLAMQRIQNELGDNADRSAYFICVLSLYWPDGSSDFVERRVYGTIAKASRGEQGHGYDPIFIPQGESRTFAEMSSEEKNAISHRGKATQALIDKFFTHAKGA